MKSVKQKSGIYFLSLPLFIDKENIGAIIPFFDILSRNRCRKYYNFVRTIGFQK